MKTKFINTLWYIEQWHRKNALCFVGISLNSRSGKSQALDMSYIVAQVMLKFMKKFGRTFAKDMTYRAPEICRNGNESTFRQNIGHSEVHCKQEHQDILYIQNASSSPSMTWQLYSNSIFIIDIYNTLSFGYSHLEVLRGRRWGRLRGWGRAKLYFCINKIY